MTQGLSPYILDQLPATVLRAVAEYFTSIARDFERAADRHERNAVHHDQVQARIAAAWSTADLVDAHLAAGMSHDQALAAAATASGFSVDLVKLAWTRAKRERARQAAADRERRVAQLVARGYSDAEIARRLQISERTVQRVHADLRRKR